MAQNDMLDKALAIGANADWITPLWSMLGGVLGWWHHFAVPRDLYADIDAMLRQKRLRQHNVMIVDDVVCFDSPAGQAKLVALLLRQRFGLEFVRPRKFQKTGRKRGRK